MTFYFFPKSSPNMSEIEITYHIQEQIAYIVEKTKEIEKNILLTLTSDLTELTQICKTIWS